MQWDDDAFSMSTSTFSKMWWCSFDNSLYAVIKWNLPMSHDKALFKHWKFYSIVRGIQPTFEQDNSFCFVIWIVRHWFRETAQGTVIIMVTKRLIFMVKELLFIFSMNIPHSHPHLLSGQLLFLQTLLPYPKKTRSKNYSTLWHSGRFYHMIGSTKWQVW